MQTQCTHRHITNVLVLFTRVALEIMQELHATSFVHEVAQLTLRYQAGQGKGAKKLPDQNGLPDEYMDALQSLDILVNDSLRHSTSTQQSSNIIACMSNTECLEPTQMPTAQNRREPQKQTCRMTHDAKAMEKAVRWTISPILDLLRWRFDKC
jgi:hypothetical protein